LNLVKKIFFLYGYIIPSLLGLHLFGPEALAADNTDSWRPIFDLVMRWVNFGILAFLLIKFTRTPLKDFFQSRKKELSREIEKLENDKEKILQNINENLKALEESSARFEKLKERIIAQGEKNKQKLIEDAHQESRILMEGAKRKIENRFILARSAFRSELIDSAIAIATDRLSKEMTSKDKRKWVDDFMASTQSRSGVQGSRLKGSASDPI
jgi:F-type H+-transporting ATPase subunit b